MVKKKTAVKTAVKPAKQPDPADIHVGQQIRARRIFLGMSQENLGDGLGVKFQQVQKYEKGTNRIGASRLRKAAIALGVTTAYFFEGLGGKGKLGLADREQAGYVVPQALSDEGLKLNRDFVRISDHNVRRRLREFVKSLADADEANSKVIKKKSKTKTKSKK